jgi:Chromate transport protein ChrA
MKEYIDLFLIFARIGGFTFGGGYAMLPMLKQEVVENRGWATENELLDYYAVGQCTPGIIAVNTATFIGYKTKGIFGGIIATLGLIAPSLVILTIIALFLNNFAEISIVKSIFSGIRVCVCMLILDAVISLAKKSVIDITTTVIFLAIAILAFFTEISPIILVLVSGISGVIIRIIKRRREGEK